MSKYPQIELTLMVRIARPLPLREMREAFMDRLNVAMREVRPVSPVLLLALWCTVRVSAIAFSRCLRRFCPQPLPV